MRLSVSLLVAHAVTLAYLALFALTPKQFGIFLALDALALGAAVAVDRKAGSSSAGDDRALLAELCLHDLRAPLHVLSFCVKSLLDKPELIRDEKYRRQLSTSAAQTVELVESVRDYLKAPAPGGPTTVGAVVGEVVKLLEPRYSDRGFGRLKFTVAPDAGAIRCAMGRRELLHVFTNLVANSCENLLANGISAPEVQVILVERSGVKVTLGVRDNGTGIKADAFDSGLGLRLVKELVEKRGGTLGAAEGAASGTLLHLTLPVS